MDLPRHDLEVPRPDSFPFAMGTFDRIGALARAEFAHRHTFYEIDLVTGGRGSHVVDLDERPLRPPQLCLIAPGQVHRWRQLAPVQGHVILFTDDFLLAYPGDRAALHSLARRRPRRLDATGAGRIRALVASMESEYRRRDPGFTTVLQAYLHVLVVEIGRLQRERPAAGSDPVGAVVLRFQELVADEAFGEWAVAAYAARLGVSASTLNEAVRRALGWSPGQVIRHRRVLEAKRLLAATELSVAQVARRIGFADAAYFCRYFRREVGVTPGGFRDSRRGIHHDPGG
ncbi:AraC family transcriptional regulator [Actinoplanes ianthinogenes]|uniref:AraC family transcriptional regulator n=1 Tax=Actinoplanes ianthinogenes TaxID=122358 RepID=A0ABN6CLT0_9ACTN|nr:AraC family transcriptional regulator [Actinoplanes ianthinogenes]BCJ46012.1 AraC family transcriptional regulator [Actinoplanes ianthinogenes]GGR25672.1 AraC family transcriptional regulator [Actinoplanes ianthinogenes]